MINLMDHEGLSPHDPKSWKPGQTILALVEDGNQRIRIELKLSRRNIYSDGIVDAFYADHNGVEMSCQFSHSEGWEFYLISDSLDPDEILTKKIYESMVTPDNAGVNLPTAEYILKQLRTVANVTLKEETT